MWLAFCSLVPLSHLSLFLPCAETASLGLPSLWDFLEMVVLLAEALSDRQIYSFELKRHQVLGPGSKCELHRCESRCSAKRWYFHGHSRFEKYWLAALSMWDLGRSA